jgi:poly(3-hydroxybutyrate) depolymerase
MPGSNWGFKGYLLYFGAAAALSLAACGAGDSPAVEVAEDGGSTRQELTTTYEAESALVSGPTVSHANAGFTGSGFVDYQNASGDFVEWTVNSTAPGTYTLGFRYALLDGASRPLSVKVNGVVANASLAFPATGSWTTWKTVTTSVTLTAGANKVRATAIGSNGGNIDNLQVTNAPSPVLAVKKTAGCGITPTQVTGSFVKYSIGTSGTKAANCADRDGSGNPVCGAWAIVRDYYVWLPVGYDPNKAYPLVFEGPGCGGTGTSVYSLANTAGPGVGNTVIRVGLKPPPNSIGHSTNPNQGCFDDKEGDDSVDFVFYERLRDTLKNQFCYDDNRVFAVGSSSGSWLANELACKYSGNTQGYGLRGIVANTGGLPTAPAYRPTCTNSPMSGVWVHEIGDMTQPFSGNKVAINRAMTVNGCTGTDYDIAQFDNYPIGGGNPDTTCKLIKGCPTIYPLVVCALPGSNHVGHDDVVNPGASIYLTSFLNPPFTN